MLTGKYLNIIAPKVDHAIKVDIQNYQINLLVNGKAQPYKTMTYKNGELNLNYGYSIKHILDKKFFKDVKKIRFSTSVAQFLEDNPYRFKHNVDVVTNQVLSTF